KIVSPYIIKNQWKLINFSIYREAGEQSCLNNLTIILPNSNFTFNGYNDTTVENNTFSVNGVELIWKANTTPSAFFCGSGPENFVVNISSNDSYGSDLFQVVSRSDNITDDINLTIFTTTIFSYNGTVYDTNGNPLSGAVASLTVLSFGQKGDVTLGAFYNTANINGTFNITGVPGLNASMGEEQGGPDEDGLFYRLTATKYNDTPVNHYAMYVGPSLPELPESELRSDFGLNNPDIYLNPAVTFHIQVGGYNYKSGPNNVNETCPGPQCPDWEPEFNWTNIGFSYGLKDKKLGFPVSSEFSSNTIEKWISAPLNRNYSLMIFPEASFPIYVDFENIENDCNITGYNLSDTGVNATCTMTNGTYLIDAIISSAMNITPLTGKVSMTNMTELWIVPYMLGAGNMIFDQDTLPFNLGQMMRWPKNDTQYDDYYNKSSGEYSIYLPATEAHSDIMLMAFAEKNNTNYIDYFKLSSDGQNFSVSEYNFTLNKLVGGVSKTISSNNISADWNNTAVVDTTAVKFNLVNNGTPLSNENAFVEIKMEINGTEYMRMTNSQNGVFTLPLIEGEGIRKLTIFSQSYAPVSTPVSASVLNGSSNTSTIKCKNGECNITLSRFDPFDPDDPDATLSIMMDFYKSNSTCDVPNPPEGCNMMGNESEGMNKTKFSPLKAILMGDISLRITSGNISVHYVKTDLLASGPPDAAFSQNATGTGLEAAWKFGSKGPEIYDEVLISMPYASSLQDKNLTVSIPLLYDNEFNPIWNFTAGDNIT
ncbi:MAG: carboxypeptidase regulatory-like domain-containing protein, partial [Candidatus Aenigmarchaeota archaeon]|nr:carboxypeptidase regulatory-like domain-containing protein [Candidatus Aenigmarchaeota archaeon]